MFHTSKAAQRKSIATESGVAEGWAQDAELPVGANRTGPGELFLEERWLRRTALPTRSLNFGTFGPRKLLHLSREEKGRLLPEL